MRDENADLPPLDHAGEIPVHVLVTMATVLLPAFWLFAPAGGAVAPAAGAVCASAMAACAVSSAVEKCCSYQNACISSRALTPTRCDRPVSDERRRSMRPGRRAVNRDALDILHCTPRPA